MVMSAEDLALRYAAGRGVPDLALRGAVTYCGSSALLSTLGMSSPYVAPVAMVLTALDVGYVE
jgi:hypothetical protein